MLRIGVSPSGLKRARITPCYEPFKIAIMGGMKATSGAGDRPSTAVQLDQASSDWRTALRNAGLRATKQRLAVLEAIRHQPHGTVEEILDQVRTDLPTITIQSVYVVISSLVSAELVRKLELPGSPARYELEGHDNHHHAVCRYCGRIEDIACVTGQAPCLHPEAHPGMTIEVAEVVYSAVCHECALAQQQEDAKN